MKVLFWIGAVLMVLGVASFFVPIPHSEKEGINAGGVHIGIETKHQETVSPPVSLLRRESEAPTDLPVRGRAAEWRLLL